MFSFMKGYSYLPMSAMRHVPPSIPFKYIIYFRVVGEDAASTLQGLYVVIIWSPPLSRSADFILVENDGGGGCG